MYLSKIGFSLEGGILKYELYGKNYKIDLKEHWGNFRAGEIIKICIEPEGGCYAHENDYPLMRLSETRLFKAGKNHKIVCLLSKEKRRELESLLKQNF